MNGLRIIAGEFRGRRIAVPEGVTVRPTADRVREALFSIIGHEIRGAAVLDAYAGSGALGLEALSRGARRTTFIEADRKVARLLHANINSLGLSERTVLLQGRVGEVLESDLITGPYDLVVADPPYSAYPGSGFLELLSRPGLLASGGLLAIEREASLSDIPTGAGILKIVDSRVYGRVAIDFYRFSRSMA